MSVNLLTQFLDIPPPEKRRKFGVLKSTILDNTTFDPLRFLQNLMGINAYPSLWRFMGSSFTFARWQPLKRERRAVAKYF